MTPTQRFHSDRYEAHYQERHPALKDTGEADLINSFVPTDCPHCAESSFSRFGQARNGVQRYRCKVWNGSETADNREVWER